MEWKIDRFKGVSHHANANLHTIEYHNYNDNNLVSMLNYVEFCHIYQCLGTCEIAKINWRIFKMRNFDSITSNCFHFKLN